MCWLSCRCCSRATDCHFANSLTYHLWSVVTATVVVVVVLVLPPSLPYAFHRKEDTERVTTSSSLFPLSPLFCFISVCCESRTGQRGGRCFFSLLSSCRREGGIHTALKGILSPRSLWFRGLKLMLRLTLVCLSKAVFQLYLRSRGSTFYLRRGLYFLVQPHI